MDYKKLLEKQVRKNLNESLLQIPELISFLEDINKSYSAFEKEKELLTRAYKITEEEYIEINKNLQSEINNRKETIQYLKQAIADLTVNTRKITSDNLMDFSTVLVEEIGKRQKLESTLDSLINNLNLGIILKDASDQIIYVNNVIPAIFEISPDRIDDLKDEVLKKIRQVRAISIKKDHYNSGQKSTEHVATQLWLLPDNRIIEENTIPYLYGNNQRGCIYTYADVTERERANELIRKSELRNNQILKGSPNSVILINSYGDIRFTNEKTIEIYGWGAEEILSKKITDLLDLSCFLHPAEKEIGTAVIEEKMLNRNFELRTVKKDGSVIWVEFSVIKMEEIHDASYCCFSKDITSRKLAEAEIGRQKKFTEDILDNIPNDVAVFDRDQKYLFINRKAVNNDETRKWLIGKTDYDYCRFKEIDDQMAQKRKAAFEEAISKKSDVEWMDEHLSKEGNPEYFQRKFHPHIENGEIKFVIGYGVDITSNILNQKELEKSLEYSKKINSELENFAYIASHDLQEPLRTISNFLSLIEMKTVDVLDEQTKVYLRFTIDAAKRMRALILDLLDYSRVGKTIGETAEDINLNELIEEIIILHEGQIRELSARISYNNLPVIHAQKTLVRQVFQNFINNALKYHKDNIPPIIRINYKDLGTHWQFSVSDNGIGIEEEYFDKIFVFFQRLNQKSKYSGTGIGLAISKKIIEEMNGKVWVESQKDIGSTFHFTIMK